MLRRRSVFSLPELFLFLLLSGCAVPDPAAPPAPTDEALIGLWRAVLTSPGGELPFGLKLERDGEVLNAVALNGEEEAPFSAVRREGGEVVLEMDWFDSRIRARLAAPDRLTGE